MEETQALLRWELARDDYARIEKEYDEILRRSVNREAIAAAHEALRQAAIELRLARDAAKDLLKQE